MIWERPYNVIETAPGKKVAEIEVRFVVGDAVGTVRITDIMLQGGRVATVWTGHPSEIKWSFDG